MLKGAMTSLYCMCMWIILYHSHPDTDCQSKLNNDNIIVHSNEDLGYFCVVEPLYCELNCIDRFHLKMS